MPSRNSEIFALSAWQSRAADLTRVSSTGCRSKVERLMTFSTSAVAACCSSATSRSRVSRATFGSLPAARERRPRPAFGALRRVTVLRRWALTVLPPLPRCLIASPEAQDGHRIGLRQRERIKLLLRTAHVRFGSKADMCSAKGHVRFTPESGHVRCN